MSGNPYLKTRALAEAAGDSPQGRNRLWWETLPMTYAEWGADERLPADAAVFRELETEFLEANPWLLRRFDFTKFRGQKVLEIGCGSGAAACLFAKAGAEVTAVDLANVAVELTSKNAAAQDLDVKALHMDAERMAFVDNSFDYVFVWGVVHHSHDPEAAVKELGRVLKPGRHGLIMVYNRWSLRYWIKGLYWLLVKGRILKGDDLDSVQRFFTDGYYHRHFGKRELNKSLTAAGLEVTGFAITHMKKKMVPLVPVWLDEYLKRTVGWLLIATFEKRPL